MKNTFVISCPIDTYSGYGARSRDFVKALIELDKFDIQILPQRWGKCAEGFLSNHTEWAFLEKYIIPQLMAKPDYWCQITVPNEFNPIGSYNIGLTAGMETTIVDGSWIEGCNRMDLILTSSNHSKQVFENTQFYKDNNEEDIVKLEKPIEVLFEGVNLDIYFKHLEFKNKDLYNEINSIPEDFTYLTVGHWMQGELGEDRKNIGLTIRAFYELFKNRPSPPALVLKTCIVNGSIMDKSEILRRINIIKNDIQNAKTLPKVYLLHGTLTDTEMNELYNHPKIKAMVSLTKGEGFGRPLLEFSAVDKPIISSNWSGQIDFLKGEFTALVGGKLDKIHQSSVVQNMIIPEAEWFRPELKDIGYAFNVVFEKYDEFLNKAKQQGSYSRDNFSFSKMKDKINKIFENNLVELPKKLELKISDIEMPKKPTLKKV
jgi:glycosyltransferase involved in cell wall biosynthesis